MRTKKRKKVVTPLQQLRNLAVSREHALKESIGLTIQQKRAIRKLKFEFNTYGHLPVNRQWRKVKSLQSYAETLLPSEEGKYHRLRKRISQLFIRAESMTLPQIFQEQKLTV